jgi:hypothetical protein
MGMKRLGLEISKNFFGGFVLLIGSKKHSKV